MSVITAYFADRLAWGWGETTISSDAMLRQALGGRPVDMAWEAPTDWDDLVLCRQTYKAAPWALRRRMKPILASYRENLLAREAELRAPGVRVLNGEPHYSAAWLDGDHSHLDAAIAMMDAKEWLTEIPDDLPSEAEAWSEEQMKTYPEGWESPLLREAEEVFFPHPRQVTPTGDHHVTGLQQDDPAWSGKVDGTVGPIRHDTIYEALTWMMEQEKIDPEGFARGDYYIDSLDPAEGGGF